MKTVFSCISVARIHPAEWGARVPSRAVVGAFASHSG
jgi:hypothetical protein